VELGGAWDVYCWAVLLSKQEKFSPFLLLIVVIVIIIIIAVIFSCHAVVSE
jgi:hypothetical protein